MQVVGMSFLYRDYGSASSFLVVKMFAQRSGQKHFHCTTHKDGYYYHCWLDYDTGLMWAQIVPMFVLVFLVSA